MGGPSWGGGTKRDVPSLSSICNPKSGTFSQEHFTNSDSNPALSQSLTLLIGKGPRAPFPPFSTHFIFLTFQPHPSLTSFLRVSSANYQPPPPINNWRNTGFFVITPSWPNSTAPLVPQSGRSWVISICIQHIFNPSSSIPEYYHIDNQKFTLNSIVNAYKSIQKGEGMGLEWCQKRYDTIPPSNLKLHTHKSTINLDQKVQGLMP